VAESVLPRATATFDGYDVVPATFSGTYNGHEYSLQGDVQVCCLLILNLAIFVILLTANSQ
jgi:hypothetical protein